MRFLVAFAVVYLVAVIVIAYYCVKTGREDSKLRNHVNNVDASMSQYCFALDFDQQEMIRRLSVPNIHDALEYTLDADTLRITFLQYGVKTLTYRLAFFVVEGRTYLKVSCTKTFYGKSRIPFYINRFFIEKTGAIAVDYIDFCKLEKHLDKI